MNHKLRGHPIKGKDLESGKILTTWWEPNASYHWDTGVAIGRYLAGFKAGKLVGVKCTSCKRLLIPPRAFCEQCFVPIHEWVEFPGTGIVNTYSVTYVKWDRSTVEKPSIPAVIEIDGATQGYGIMHMLGEVDPKEIKIGMKVKACWKPAGEREGSVTDIMYFKPV